MFSFFRYSNIFSLSLSLGSRQLDRRMLIRRILVLRRYSTVVCSKLLSARSRRVELRRAVKLRYRTRRFARFEERSGPFLSCPDSRTVCKHARRTRGRTKKEKLHHHRDARPMTVCCRERQRKNERERERENKI